MTQRTVVVGVLVALVVGVFGWRAVASNTTRPPHYVVLVDRSVSSLASCAVIDAALAQTLDGPDVRRGSSLTLLGTGDSAAAPEPRSIWNGELPVDSRVFEGRSRRAAQRREFIDGVAAQCRKTPSTSSSPIFLGVKRALEHLRARDCGPDSRCAIYVGSDGDENVEPHLRRSIAKASGTAIVPAPLANDGIRVVFCGLAQTAKGAARGAARSATSPERADRLLRVWTAAFSDPELVVFAPFCHA